MTELELFGWAIVFATGLCVAVWLVLAYCMLFSVWGGSWGKYERR